MSARRKLLQATAALVPALLAAMLLGACMSRKTASIGLSFVTVPKGVILSTSPAGAHILVDGADSGFVTPCAMALDKGSWHRIDFDLDGYQAETRILKPDGKLWTLLWNDMDHFGPRTFRFPFWLGLGEFLIPVRYSRVSSPGRIHVDLLIADAEAALPRLPAATRLPLSPVPVPLAVPETPVEPEPEPTIDESAPVPSEEEAATSELSDGLQVLDVLENDPAAEEAESEAPAELPVENPVETPRSGE